MNKPEVVLSLQKSLIKIAMKYGWDFLNVDRMLAPLDSPGFCKLVEANIAAVRTRLHAQARRVYKKHGSTYEAIVEFNDSLLDILKIYLPTFPPFFSTRDALFNCGLTRENANAVIFDLCLDTDLDFTADPLNAILPAFYLKHLPKSVDNAASAIKGAIIYRAYVVEALEKTFSI